MNDLIFGLKMLYTIQKRTVLAPFDASFAQR